MLFRVAGGLCALALLSIAACSDDPDPSAPAAVDAGADSPSSTLNDAASADDASSPDGASDAGTPARLPSLNGSVNAVVHAGARWYVGGSFDAVSRYRAPNALVLGPGDVPGGCDFGTGFNSTVNAIATIGDAVYVGGRFTRYRGAIANRIAKIDANTCALDTTFNPQPTTVGGAEPGNGVNEPVHAIVTIGNAVYVGGEFNSYRQVTNSAWFIAKLDATSGALDTTFSPPANNGFELTSMGKGVFAMVASNNALYVGGRFSTYRGVPFAANGLAKLDPTTGAIDATFSPAGQLTNGFGGPGGTSAAVRTLATNGTSLYAGGYFASYRGIASSANYVAKLDMTSGAIDTTFSPPGALSNGFNREINALTVSNGALYAGGVFSKYRDVNTGTNLAKLDATTGAPDTAFSVPGQGFDSGVYAIHAANGALYVGGTFKAYRGAAFAHGLIKLNPLTGAVDPSLLPPGTTYPGLASDANAGAAFVFHNVQNQLWIGGGFAQFAGDWCHHIVALDDTTFDVDKTFDPPGPNSGFSFDVWSLAVSKTALFVGGSSAGPSPSYRGVPSSAASLAKLDLVNGALDLTFNPPTFNGVDGTIYAVATADDSVFIGGGFSAYRGVANSARNLAKLDFTTGALDTTFSPPGVNANGFNQSVNALAISGGSLYVGGDFSTYHRDSALVNRIAKLDRQTGAIDLGFTPPGTGFDAVVNALAVTPNALFVGGAFETYRTTSSAKAIAKLDLGTGALDSTFSPPAANGFAGGPVQALLVDGSSVWVGGSFIQYRAVPDSAFGLAKLAVADGTLDTTFSPPGKLANGFVSANAVNGEHVNALARRGEGLFVGGVLQTYRGAATSSSFVALSSTTGDRL
jgi:hypothetical protein